MDEPETRVDAIKNDIEAVFKRFDWGYEKLDDMTFRTGIAGDNGVFSVFIKVTEHWVVALINPFVDRPDEGWGPTAKRLMATSNHAMNMAKLGLDGDDDAFLTVELPSEGFCESHFYDTLAALSHYADEISIPLLQAVRIDALNAATASEIAS